MGKELKDPLIIKSPKVKVKVKPTKTKEKSTPTKIKAKIKTKIKPPLIKAPQPPIKAQLPKVQTKLKVDRKKILKKINSYTIKLNQTTLSMEEITRLRTKRRKCVEAVLPLVKSTEPVFLVPFVKGKIYVTKDVAIVGNAAEIIGQRYGFLIDQHTTVIRFNSGTTVGYERDVGTKTTHLFCTTHYYNNKRKRKAADGQICQIKIDMRKLRNLSVIGVITGPDKSASLRNNKQFDHSIRLGTYYNNMIYQNQATQFWSSKLHNKLKFTGGISVLLSLIDLGLVPHCYGFTHNLDSKYRTYYWPDIVRDKRQNQSHDFAKEYQVLSFYRRKNLMVFHE